MSFSTLFSCFRERIMFLLGLGGHSRTPLMDIWGAAMQGKRRTGQRECGFMERTPLRCLLSQHMRFREDIGGHVWTTGFSKCFSASYACVESCPASASRFAPPPSCLSSAPKPHPRAAKPSPSPANTTVWPSPTKCSHVCFVPKPSPTNQQSLSKCATSPALCPVRTPRNSSPPCVTAVILPPSSPFFAPSHYPSADTKTPSPRPKSWLKWPRESKAPTTSPSKTRATSVPPNKAKHGILQSNIGYRARNSNKKARLFFKSLAFGLSDGLTTQRKSVLPIVASRNLYRWSIVPPRRMDRRCKQRRGLS